MEKRVALGFSRRKGKTVQPGKPFLLAFSGPIQSGKSTVSEELGRILGVPVASFGRYVRDEAKTRTDPSMKLRPVEDRRRLQELGQQLLDSLGADEFCRAVLSASQWTEGESVVIDGVRHFAILDALRRLGNCYLVYLEVDDSRRRAGLLASGYTEDDIAAMDAHPTEREVIALRESADLVLEDEPVDELVQAVLRDITAVTSLEAGHRSNSFTGAGVEYHADEARLEFRALHSTELVTPVGTESSRIARYRAERKIFAYENGELSFPDWQFDEFGEPLPVIAEVLHYLRPHLSEMEVAKWFVEEQQALDGFLPYELVRKDPLRLVAAARSAAELIDPDSIRMWKDVSGGESDASPHVREVERWHAEVLEVDDARGSFLARMVKASGSPVPRDASFPIAQVHPRDRHRLTQGATFTWLVTERDLSESRQRCSSILFSPPRYLSGADIAEALEAGDDLIEVLGHD